MYKLLCIRVIGKTISKHQDNQAFLIQLLRNIWLWRGFVLYKLIYWYGSIHSCLTNDSFFFVHIPIGRTASIQCTYMLLV